MNRSAAALYASLLGAGLVASGCGAGGAYSGPSPVLPPAHVRKVCVTPFANHTQFFGLEDKLRLKVEEELIRDGRFSYVNAESEADGVLSGEIVNYIKEPLSYDANHVEEELKLWVVMNIRFTDRVNNVVLWEEPRLNQEYHYFVETKPGGSTEEEARTLLWERFAGDIVKRVVEGFGSVSGASERKISTQPLPSSKGGSADPAAPQEKRPPREAPPSPY